MLAENLIEKLAPGLWGRLKSENLALAKHLSLAFEEAIKLGALNETLIKREPGVSFNPFPARLCQILYQIQLERQAETLASSFFCACDLKQLESNLKDPFKEEKNTALQAISDLKPSGLISQKLRFAYELDLIRHLHMSNLTLLEKQKLIKSAKDQLALRIISDQTRELEKYLELAIKRSEQLYNQACES